MLREGVFSASVQMPNNYSTQITSNVLETTKAKTSKIFVVDDDLTALILAEDSLGDMGFQVKSFSDSKTALERAIHDKPDLIILDVMMPVLDGNEFCRRIRACERTKDVPILITTSYDSPACISQSYEAGATSFTAKPINWNIEVNRIRQILKATSIATELKFSEHKNHRAIVEWEKTFHAIGDIVALIDDDMKIVRCNTATEKATGRTRRTIEGRQFSELFHFRESIDKACLVKRAFQTGKEQIGECSSENPKGVYLVTASPVMASESVARVILVAKNITAQREMEDNLRHSQKIEALGTLAAGLAHDFSNLLQSIMGNAEFMRLTRTWDEECDTAIEKASSDALELTNQLQSLSRKDITAADRQKMNLNEIIMRFLNMVARSLPNKVLVSFTPSETPILVDCVGGQIDQVLMNLCINGSHAMDGCGTLKLQLNKVTLNEDSCREFSNAQPGDYARLTVSDTGSGMDKETVSKIFDPFFTTKEQGIGTGLGLSITYGLIESHGGWIQCESTPGNGTRFIVFLPVSKR